MVFWEMQFACRARATAQRWRDSALHDAPRGLAEQCAVAPTWQLVVIARVWTPEVAGTWKTNVDLENSGSLLRVGGG